MRTGTKTGKTFPAVIALLLILPLCAGCAKTQPRSTRAGFAMGSVLTAAVYADEDTASAALTDAFLAVNETDTRLSATLPEAEIARLNASGEARISAETGTLLTETLRLCEALGETLDITLGAATELWGFTGDTPAVPDPAALTAALATRGIQNVITDGETASLAPGQKLDLGAVGKGAGCDAARAALDAYGAPAVFTLGGTVLLYGCKPDGDWSVGVRDPFGAENEYFALLSFRQEDREARFISTSGSYEKTFTENGKTYHHILDPKTGYPVETDLVAVTAVSRGGLLSDALSTALFVNGLNETSLAWVNKYLDGAVFVFADGRVYVTPGLRDAFELTDTARFTLTDTYD